MYNFRIARTDNANTRYTRLLIIKYVWGTSIASLSWLPLSSLSPSSSSLAVIITKENYTNNVWQEPAICACFAISGEQALRCVHVHLCTFFGPLLLLFFFPILFESQKYFPLENSAHRIKANGQFFRRCFVPFVQHRRAPSTVHRMEKSGDTDDRQLWHTMTTPTPRTVTDNEPMEAENIARRVMAMAMANGEENVNITECV